MFTAETIRATKGLLSEEIEKEEITEKIIDLVEMIISTPTVRLEPAMSVDRRVEQINDVATYTEETQGQWI